MNYVQATAELAKKDFARARRAAIVAMLLRFVRGRQNDLLPFEDVRSRLFIRGQYDRGVQSVPVAKIVGSQGRATDFDRFFRPMNNATEQRWKSIMHARYRDVELPPIELYKLSDIYFVRDGNHRVSVARRQGAVELDAYVIELTTDVPLNAELFAQDLTGKEEQSDFLEWTNLAQMRPSHNIQVTEPGGYLDLIGDINRQRRDLSHERAEEITPEEAIAGWYDTVYMPVVAAMRHWGMPQAFPRRTEADLYLAVMSHRQMLVERCGQAVEIDLVVGDFMCHYGPRWVRLFSKRLAYSISAGGSAPDQAATSGGADGEWHWLGMRRLWRALRRERTR